MLGDFNLLAVLKNLFQVIAGRSEFAEFAVQLFFHLGANLVRAFGHDGDALINIMSLLFVLFQVARNRGSDI